MKDATEVLYHSAVSMEVSIHASVKDATCYDFCDVIMTRVSIHASVKDATTRCAVFGMFISFQSTRP